VRTLRIPIRRDRYNDPGRFEGQWTLNIRGTRCNVGYVSPTGRARHVFQGPKLPGPYAYLVTLPVVIDNHGGSGAEAARNRAAGTEHDAQPGDRISIDGHTWTIVPTPNHTYTLRPAFGFDTPQPGDVLESTGGSGNNLVVAVDGDQVTVRSLHPEGTRGTGWTYPFDPTTMWVTHRPATP
jgi:hypothetical protein